MNKYQICADFKVKVTSTDADTVANAIDQISRLYEHTTHSSVIASRGPRDEIIGWHGFVTVTKEAA